MGREATEGGGREGGRKPLNTLIIPDLFGIGE